MHFLAPEYLWLLLIAPALGVAYLLALRRRKKSAIRYADLSLVKQAIGPAQRWRRHVPPALFLLAIVASILTVARPSAVVTLPNDSRTVVLAMDVSLSMRAMDVEPNRMRAAQTAAKDFVKQLPRDVRAGIVTFAGNAVLVQPPTHDREELTAAIDRFQMQRHTAIGSGIIVSLATLFPEEGIEVDSAFFGSAASRDSPRKGSLDRLPKAEKKAFKPVPPGSFQSAAIILLTDGRRTIGPDPLDAAKMAADHGVRVFTVGFGSATGGNVDIDGMSIYMRFDEETLKAVAAITRAEYYHAGTAADLKTVYEGLNTRFALERKDTEISALVIALAALLAVGSAALSLAWFNRLV